MAGSPDTARGAPADPPSPARTSRSLLRQIVQLGQRPGRLLLAPSARRGGAARPAGAPRPGPAASASEPNDLLLEQAVRVVQGGGRGGRRPGQQSRCRSSRSKSCTPGEARGRRAARSAAREIHRPAAGGRPPRRPHELGRGSAPAARPRWRRTADRPPAISAGQLVPSMRPLHPMRPRAPPPRSGLRFTSDTRRAPCSCRERSTPSAASPAPSTTTRAAGEAVLHSVRGEIHRRRADRRGVAARAGSRGAPAGRWRARPRRSRPSHVWWCPPRARRRRPGAPGPGSRSHPESASPGLRRP